MKVASVFCSNYCLMSKRYDKRVSDNFSNSVKFGRYKNYDYDTAQDKLYEKLFGFNPNAASKNNITISEQDILNCTKNSVKKPKYTDLIDVNSIDDLGIKVIHKNLISGAKLFPEEMNRVKNAGIRTIIALPGANSAEYEKTAKNLGLNYINLFGEEGEPYNSSIFDTNTRDNKFLQQGISTFVEDMKKYFDIINGKNEKYEGPYYMGCERGVSCTNFVNCLDYVFNLGNEDYKLPYGINNSFCKGKLENLWNNMPEKSIDLLELNEKRSLVSERLKGLVRPL